MTATLTEADALKGVIEECKIELGQLEARAEWADGQELEEIAAYITTLNNRISVAQKELGQLAKARVEEKQKTTKEKMQDVTPPSEPLARYEYDKDHKRICTKVQVDLVQQWAKANGFLPFVIQEPYTYEQLDNFIAEAKRNLAVRSEPAQNQDEYDARLAELRQEILVKEQFQPQTKDDFEWVVDKMVAAQMALEQRKKIWEEDQKALQRTIDNLEYLYFEPLKDFCKQECIASGKKTVKFRSGKFTFTKQNEGFILDPADKNKTAIASELGVLGAATREKLGIETYTAYRWNDIEKIKEFASQRLDRKFKGLIWKEEDEWANPKVKA